jgi:hypothetical protein
MKHKNLLLCIALSAVLTNALGQEINPVIPTLIRLNEYMQNTNSSNSVGEIVEDLGLENAIRVEPPAYMEKLWILDFTTNGAVLRLTAKGSFSDDYTTLSCTDYQIVTDADVQESLLNKQKGLNHVAGKSTLAPAVAEKYLNTNLIGTRLNKIEDKLAIQPFFEFSLPAENGKSWVIYELDNSYLSILCAGNRKCSHLIWTYAGEYQLERKKCFEEFTSE